MAVENKYVNSDAEADKNGVSAFIDGDKTAYMVATFETAAADDDGSVYRLFKNVNHNWIPAKIEIACDAITGGTDWDLGLYEPTVGGVAGAVVDKDKFMDGQTFASAVAFASAIDGLQTLDISEVQERIYELAGDTLDDKKLGYDIALTANTVGSAAGTISVKAWFVQG
jgi:hypothetical protein